MEILLFKTITRKQRRKVRILTEERAGIGISDPDVGDADSKRIHIAQVRDVIETMALGKNYEVISLTLRGRTVPEIASILNISENTVRTHLKRGIRQIRKAIGGHSSKPQASLAPAASE